MGEPGGVRFAFFILAICAKLAFFDGDIAARLLIAARRSILLGGVSAGSRHKRHSSSDRRQNAYRAHAHPSFTEWLLFEPSIVEVARVDGRKFGQRALRGSHL